ncbi:MAG: di-trans,poly-cis-decaprenylcistransferase [Simkaniaceae bacterium]|nr:MAG: di-trans,poly-cis-decaprenylcistransferase [Simkaniaceae bacterium]
MNSPSTETLEKPIFTEEEFALIDPTYVPNHIVIIMDGNRRWARRQGLPPEMGHWQGAEQLDIIVRAAAELGVKTLTVYSFSTENWNRSKHEVDMLMQLLEAYLKNKKEMLVKEGVRLNTIGDTDRLPEPVKKALTETMQATKNGDQIDLVLALNYGGRDEIRRAFMKMGQAEKEGKLDWNQVTEETISSYLDTATWKDPELFIRPSGEQRVSNFLIWQISYSEIYVTDVLWPDFSPKNLLEAVIDYQKRNRRYGG